MCGISGVFHYGDGQTAEGPSLRRMAAAIVHRGPDDEGFLEDGAVGFAFRRLSIIDLGGGHQPILSEDGERAIIFNGEIYNFPELRRDFEAQGRRFLTRSDTEVILAAYERHGESCAEKLRGMFAFAVWDRRHRRLLLGRDRLGVKPLYYYDDGRTLVFGSEIKAILAHENLRLAIDPEAVADYFSLRYVPAPRSIFRQIRKLPPGHVLAVEAGGTPRLRRYWALRFQPDETKTEAQWVEGLRHHLDEAVRIRLMSEVPLGAFLSGGIDSSAVVATMARWSDRPVSTHSIGFSEAAFDETPHARQLAQHCHTDHHEQTIRPDALAVIDKLAWHFDEPFADASAVPTYYVSKMAREKVTVALSGDGGDESFAGYARRYAFERREDRIRRLLPTPVRRILFGLPARIYPKADWLPRPLRAKTMLTNLALAPHEAFFNTMSLASGTGLSSLLSPGFRAQIDGYVPSELFRRLMADSGTGDPVSRAQYVDIHTFMVDDILAKVDRASMAVSLEAREPLLDHVLMEYAATIPSRFKLQGNDGKVIFKAAIADRVPASILARKKQGFEIPIGAWFKGPIRDFAGDVLFSQRTSAEDFLDASEVRRLWDRHQSGIGDHTHSLWTVMMFKLWAARFHR
jgi:asparagine synthase (glutamine-hydrolysing)